MGFQLFLLPSSVTMAAPAPPTVVISAPKTGPAVTAQPIPDEATQPGDYHVWRLVTKSGAKFFNLNPYEVLQVPLSATEDEIKKAFRKVRDFSFNSQCTVVTYPFVAIISASS